jgi:hypothetical protein
VNHCAFCVPTPVKPPGCNRISSSMDWSEHVQETLCFCHQMWMSAFSQPININQLGPGDFREVYKRLRDQHESAISQGGEHVEMFIQPFSGCAPLAHIRIGTGWKKKQKKSKKSYGVDSRTRSFIVGHPDHIFSPGLVVRMLGPGVLQGNFNPWSHMPKTPLFLCR